MKLPGEKEKSIVTLDEVRTKLVAIGELSTYSGQYTVKKGRDFFRNVLDDIRIPWTTNNVTIECEGIVKVGYDVSEIGVDIAAFAIDKIAAIEGRSRIRIVTLLGLAFIGGSIGGLIAMYLFRHKIRKDYFTVGIPLIMVMQPNNLFDMKQAL